MYLRYVIDPLPQTLAERKAHDIVSRHIEARNKVVHLRRKLQVNFKSKNEITLYYWIKIMSTNYNMNNILNIGFRARGIPAWIDRFKRVMCCSYWKERNPYL